ncbi:MAG: IS30 family transposase [Flammeovirgaceae bacterium]|jgi:IS30 family transposase
MSHLTAEQRYTIQAMLEQGFSRKKICATIGKSKSVLSRELKRNSDGRSSKYNADLAHRKYEQRQKGKSKNTRFTDEVCRNVESLIRQEYSPEQVVGTLDKQGKSYVSIERIYQHVWAEKKSGGTLYMHLRTKGKRYRDRDWEVFSNRKEP